MGDSSCQDTEGRRLSRRELSFDISEVDLVRALGESAKSSSGSLPGENSGLSTSGE